MPSAPSPLHHGSPQILNKAKCCNCSDSPPSQLSVPSRAVPALGKGVGKPWALMGCSVGRMGMQLGRAALMVSDANAPGWVGIPGCRCAEDAVTMATGEHPASGPGLTALSKPEHFPAQLPGTVLITVASYLSRAFIVCNELSRFSWRAFPRRLRARSATPS